MSAELELLRKEEDTFDEDLSYGLTTGMMFGVVILLLPALMSAASAQSRVAVLAEAIEPVAVNAGRIWLQLTPAGQANELRMIAENSTGAFETMLLGLST